MSRSSGKRGLSVREEPEQKAIITTKSLVREIYNNILKALSTGVNVDEALENHMPLLISELDKLLIIYPEARAVLKYAVDKLWVRQFENIPKPEITEGQSAYLIMRKIKETLSKNKIKFITQQGMSTSVEVEKVIDYNTLLFMNSVCSFVFSMFGVLT